MTGTELGVTVAGLAAIVWVNWYFFVAGRQSVVAAVPGSGGAQTVRIVVQGGYQPAVVKLRAGRPARLEFDRRETSSCTEEVVLPDFGIRTFLPAHQVTPVSFTPSQPGSYEFACGMGMVHGRLEVEE